MFNRITVTSSLFILLTAGTVSADIIDITLNSNPAYITGELEAYLHYANGTNEPLVGFNAVNIGDGSGDGVDEVVAFSFLFQPITNIDNAYLTLDLTPRGTSTDELLFADNMSIRGAGVSGAKFYGNTLFRSLPNGVRTSITFDLQQMSFTDPQQRYVGTEDLSIYLHDGDFNVVYADDAIIHSARLRINTGFIELPPLPPPQPPQPPHNVPEADENTLFMAGIAGTAFLLLLGRRKQSGKVIP